VFKRHDCAADKPAWPPVFNQEFGSRSNESLRSIRRECLDRVIVGNACGLRRVRCASVEYYKDSRTHLSLEKDLPEPRAVTPTSHPRWSRFLKSADHIIGTNVALEELVADAGESRTPEFSCERPSSGWRGWWRLSLRTARGRNGRRVRLDPRRHGYTDYNLRTWPDAAIVGGRASDA
jgi:hypothetical protein